MKLHWWKRIIYLSFWYHTNVSPIINPMQYKMKLFLMKLIFMFGNTWRLNLFFQSKLKCLQKYLSEPLPKLTPLNKVTFSLSKLLPMLYLSNIGCLLVTSFQIGKSLVIKFIIFWCNLPDPFKLRCRSLHRFIMLLRFKTVMFVPQHIFFKQEFTSHTLLLHQSLRWRILDTLTGLLTEVVF